MIKVLFVCHGNICRSVMAEYICKNLLENAGCSYIEAFSAATHTDELGNDIYPPAKRILTEKGIPFAKHQARQIRKSEYEDFDYFIGMDTYNIQDMLRCFGSDPDNKIKLLLNRPVADPWYTGDFEAAYNDILEGVQQLLKELMD